MSTVSSITVTGVDAQYYYVKDFDRALAFYRDVLGMTVAMSQPGMFAEFTFPGGEAFGLYKSDEGGFKSGAGVMFAVPDVHAAVAALKAAGYAPSDHVEDTPACYMGFCDDTEGNSFILHQRKT
jgi:predicted enzyme related to lactoylglutathione lyase